MTRAMKELQRVKKQEQEEIDSKKPAFFRQDRDKKRELTIKEQ